MIRVVTDELCPWSLIIDFEFDSHFFFEGDRALVGRFGNCFDIDTVARRGDSADCGGVRHTKDNALVSFARKLERQLMSPLIPCQTINRDLLAGLNSANFTTRPGCGKGGKEVQHTES